MNERIVSAKLRLGHSGWAVECTYEDGTTYEPIRLPVEEEDLAWEICEWLNERDAVAALSAAAKKAREHIASVGYPADAEGRYVKGGEYTFAGALTHEPDAAEIKAAFLTLDAAIARFKDKP